MCNEHVSVHSLQPGRSHMEYLIPEEFIKANNNLVKVYKGKEKIGELSKEICECTYRVIQYLQDVNQSALAKLDELDKNCNEMLIRYYETGDMAEVAEAFDLEFTSDKNVVNSLLGDIGDFFEKALLCDWKVHWVHEDSLESFDIFANNVKNMQKPLSSIGTGTQILSLGANKTLCYGGVKDNKVIGAMVILNNSNKEIKFLKPGRPRAYGASVLFNEKIYFFGGWGGNLLSDCQIFSLKNEWTNGSQLPEPSNYCQSVNFNGIWITGYNMKKVYIYDGLAYIEYLDCYSGISKYLLASSTQLHILYHDKAFIVSEENLTEVNVNGSIDGYICSTVINKPGFSYFTVMSSNGLVVKRYDFTSRTIENLMKVR